MSILRGRVEGLVLIIAVAVVHTPAAAQDSTTSAGPDGERHAVVVRNVNLRSGPSTGAPIIRLLRPPDEFTLREDTTTNNFYSVRTEDDEDGWVWARNIRVIMEAEEPVSALLAAPPAAAAAGAVTSVDESWEKPAPNHSSFTSAGKHCGDTGDGGDEETNLRKNRTDLPSSYHDVTFDAIAGLNYPVGPKHRHDWPAESLAKIEKFEGAALRVQGYLVALKPQTGGSGESTNCHFTHANEVDWHIALVGDAGQGEEESVVIETTPRIRRKHSHWTVANLKPWVDADAPVRISGWLMFDPEHRNHLGKYRSTLWEIHPITRIEVWRDGDWMDLDEFQ
jgi:Bacterial SH3 domain